MKAIICDKCKKIIEAEELSETTSLHFLNYRGAKYNVHEGPQRAALRRNETAAVCMRGEER